MAALMGAWQSADKAGPSAAVTLAVQRAFATADAALERGDFPAAERSLRECLPDVNALPEAEGQTYALLVHQRLGHLAVHQGRYQDAAKAFGCALAGAQDCIDRRCQGLYLMLNRYVECATAKAECHLRLLVAEGTQGASENAGLFAETSPRSRRETLLEPSPLDLSAQADTPSEPSRESSRRPSGIALSVQRQSLWTGVLTPILAPGTHATARDDPFIDEHQRHLCAVEALLLRCVETVEDGHSRRSELLLGPLNLLTTLYQSLELWDEGARVLRRLCGILLVKYGHDHAAHRAAHRRLQQLDLHLGLLERHHAATLIAGAWRMRSAVMRYAKEMKRAPKRAAVGACSAPGDLLRGDASAEAEQTFSAAAAARDVGDVAPVAALTRAVALPTTPARAPAARPRSVSPQQSPQPLFQVSPVAARAAGREVSSAGEAAVLGINAPTWSAP